MLTLPPCPGGGGGEGGTSIGSEKTADNWFSGVGAERAFRKKGVKIVNISREKKYLDRYDWS